MQAVNFLNPALLWGLGLASIPIIIHLLFRRQFRRIEWAPMRYLKLTIQRNRRRVQLEQLLLLLMRIASIALLALLVARPVVHLLGLGSWLGGSSRTSTILVLDDSLSMGLTIDGRTNFDRAVELASYLVRDLGPQDRFTVVLASEAKKPLLREAATIETDQIVQLLKQQKPSAAFVAWGPTMRDVDDLLGTSTYPTREVILLTDLQRTGWEMNLKELADRWAADSVRLRIYSLAGERPHQLALEELKALEPCAVAGAASRWEAVVHNDSTENLEHVTATLLVDGKPNQLELPAIGSGQRVKVPLAATFQEPGLHHLSLKLPDDALNADNQRWNIVDVRERLRVAIVDGQPSAEPLAGEADFLALALSLGAEESTPLTVEILTDAELSSLGQDSPDVVVLANVSSLTMPQAQRLRSLVEGGMGLMIFVGDQIDPDNYNQILQRDGIELMPAQLESISDQPVSGVLLESNSPSPLDAMRQLNASVLERIKTEKYYQLRMPEENTPGVRVLARWNDASSSPAVVEKVVGRGRVLLWTTTANKSWTEWPTQPSYVLAMRECAKNIVRPAGAHDLTAGEVIRRSIAEDAQVRSPTIEIPGATEPKSMTIEAHRTATSQEKPAAAANENRSSEKALTFSDTRQPGLYRLNWQNDSGPGSDLFAVNPDARESDLTPITVEALRGLWGNLQPEIITGLQTTSDLSTRGQEIWRPLAMCLMVLMAVEACFATWTGRQR
jgi:hypothetical protein